MTYPKPKRKAVLVKKSESWLMRFLAMLPFTPEAFMTRFWTTMGTKIYVPTRYDRDEDWGTEVWIERHQQTWDHENIHMAQEERWGKLIHSLLYVGPSVFLLVAASLAWPLCVWLDVSWWLMGGLGIAVAVLSPLTVGLAWGRWRVEREAYLVQMDYAASTNQVDFYAEWIADSLWKNYFFTWPPSWSKKWLLEQVALRAKEEEATEAASSDA